MYDLIRKYVLIWLIITTNSIDFGGYMLYACINNLKVRINLANNHHNQYWP